MDRVDIDGMIIYFEFYLPDNPLAGNWILLTVNNE